MSRVRYLLLAALLGALLPTPAQSAVEIPANFSFSGAGWGHGVGMSQYGALGMAREGRSETEILQHYYPTTSIAPVRDDMDIRVNLLNQVTSAVIRVSGSADSVMQILPGDNKEPNLTPIATINFNQSLNFAVSGSMVLASVGAKDVSTRLDPSAVFTIRWSGTRFLDGVDAWARVGTNASAPLYRYGQIVVRAVNTSSGTALVVNNDVRIHDEYLRGLAEMPSSWPPAALKSQVIAARSYALSRYGTGKLTAACGCHVYSSVQDQRFTGWAKEAEANWGAKWAGAVAETAADPLNGYAIVANGKPITAYFFSSSGGRTQDVTEVWGKPIQWLVSVPDPWSIDPLINPSYASWTRSVTQATMAKAFGLADVVSVTFPLRTAGGGVKSAVAQSSSGLSATLTGEIFRSRVKLPSTYLMRGISRIEGPTAAALAVATNKISRAQATSAVLSDDGGRDLSAALAAVGLAALNAQPHLLLTAGVLPQETGSELSRRKIKTVTIVGGSKGAPSGVVKSLQALGIKVTRVTATSALSTVSTQRTGDPIMLSTLDPDIASSAVGLAARDGRPVVLLGAAGLTEPLRTQLKQYAGRNVTVVGRQSSISAAVIDELSLSMTVLDLREPDSDALTTSAARALDMQGIRVLIVDGVASAIAASSLQQAVAWIPIGLALPDSLATWIRERPRLVQITVMGSSLGDDIVQALRALS